MSIDAAADRVSPRSTGTWPSAVEERRHGPSPQAGRGEVLGLGEVEDLPARGQRGEDLVGEGDVVAGDDHRARCAARSRAPMTSRPVDARAGREPAVSSSVRYSTRAATYRPARPDGRRDGLTQARRRGASPAASRRNTSYWCCENRGQRQRTPRDGRTRDAVARLVLERGPQTAAALAERLGLSPAADPPPSGRAGRRRPARRARPRPVRAPRAAVARPGPTRSPTPGAPPSRTPTTTWPRTALRYLRDTGGEAAVAAFAEHRARDARADAASTPHVDRRRGRARRADAARRRR